ncbi:hypothetical protein NIES4071_103310 (plasmid) [Calothrix sp. NIES-4071]|nr:hypothetical protein NIES4071_103310 [Calothrix sp. NIES-4071]BAZ64712.1 hypothetical protein NIES4105_104450 [Calothrix sp. NIES-4105]BDA75921.1 hypothetical protein CAL7716_100870 [Calothrix sp. PCC 7716]
MWSRLTFWGVFAAFILNILQPGYMQFYDVRKPMLALLTNLKMPATKEAGQVQENATKTPESSPTPSPAPKSTCQPPKNDYDRILFAQGIGGCNATNN